MKLQYYKDSNNTNNIDERYYSSASKEINKEKQNNYLIKYRELYGNSFSDIELIDIFTKNNYNDDLIKTDIKALLAINDSKKLDFSENKEEHYSPSFGHISITKKNNINNEDIKKKMYFNSPKKEKDKENNSQKDTEVPSDYAPPPKHDEIRNIKVMNNKNINDILLEYKKEMFNKLKNNNYSYKSTKSKNDELNYDNVAKCKTEKNNKKYYEKDIINKNKNYNKINNNVIKNNSPGPECMPFDNKKNNQINNNQGINKDLKKKYIKYFFGNMKNYKNNIRTNNQGKSPDITKRKNILDSSPDKVEYYEKKVYTYKNESKNKFIKSQTPYYDLEMESKVNDISITSCYDNPQRDQILKMISQKKKQNPDKIVEVLFTQFPTPLPFYSDMYQSYNQYNPYMNMYMMPPQNYPIQSPIAQQSFNNNQIPKYNSNQNIQGLYNTNNNQTFETNTRNLTDSKNSLVNSELNHINNTTPNLNYNLNNNYLISNNIGIDNVNNKSLGNLSNSGNINTSSSFK